MQKFLGSAAVEPLAKLGHLPAGDRLMGTSLEPVGGGSVAELGRAPKLRRRQRLGRQAVLREAQEAVDELSAAASLGI